jgi:hypothetical protein
LECCLIYFGQGIQRETQDYEGIGKRSIEVLLDETGERGEKDREEAKNITIAIS